MEPEVAARLRALEERVAELERLAPATPSVRQPKPPAAAAPSTAKVVRGLTDARPAAATPPQPTTTARRDDRFEAYLGGTVLGRLGAAALFLAAAYFAQLGWQHLGPGAKVLGIYALGASLLGLGAWLRPRVAPRYVAILWGAAVADMYLAGVVAKLAFDLVSTPVALSLLVGACTLGQLLAQQLRVQAIATVALAGAVAAPMLCGGDAATPTLLLVYLLAVHTWAAWVEHRWQWLWARGVAFVGAGVVAWAWYATHWQSGDASLVVSAQLFHLGLVAPELLAAIRRVDMIRERTLAVSCSAALLTLGFALHAVIGDGLPAHPLASGLAWLAVAAALAPRAEELARDLGRLGGVLVPLGLLIAWPHLWDAGPAANAALQGVAWLATTGGLLALRRRIGAGELGATFAVLLAVGCMLATRHPAWSIPLALASAAVLVVGGRVAPARIGGLVLGLLAAGGAVSAHAPTSLGLHVPHLAAAAVFGWLAAAGFAAAARTDFALARAAAIATACGAAAWSLHVFVEAAQHDLGARAWPLWNTPTLAFAAAVAAHFTGWKPLTTAARPDRRPAFEWRVALIAAGLLATYAFGLGEVMAALAPATYSWQAVGVSLYSALFAAALLILGFRRDLRTARLSALAMFLAVTVKVGLYDLSYVPTPLRVLVTGALGTVLLVAAWSYSRRKASP